MNDQDKIRGLLLETEAKLAQSRPRAPVGPLEFFKASICREYGIVENAENAASVNSIVAQAWASLQPSEQAPFEASAAEDRQRHQEELRIYEDMQAQYARLKALARAQGVVVQGEAGTTFWPQPAPRQPQHRAPPPQPARQPQYRAPPPPQQQQQQQQQQRGQTPAQQLQVPPDQVAAAAKAAAQVAQEQSALVAQLQQGLAEAQRSYAEQLQQAEAAAARLPAPLGQALLERSRQALLTEWQQRQGQLQAQISQAQSAVAAARGVQQQMEWQLAEQERQRRQAAAAPRPQPGRQQQQLRRQASGESAWDEDEEEEQRTLPKGVPETIEVSCQAMNGTMHILRQQVTCHCDECARLPPTERVWSCPQWEAHTGAGNAKKWKTSLRVRPGLAPGVPAGGNGMMVLKWLEKYGVNYSRPKGGPMVNLGGRLTTRVPEQGAAQAPGEKTYTSERILQKKQERQRELEQQQREEEARRRAAGANADGAAAAVPTSPLRGSAASQQLSRRLSGRLEGRPSKYRMAATLGYRMAAGGGAGGKPRQQPEHAGGAKEAHRPWLDVREGRFQPINVRYSGERCCVCDLDGDFDFDQLVSCDLCGLTVHQSCYGIMELPGPDDTWLCRACELRDEGGPPPQCCVCPVIGGALKPTSIRGVWCHSACMQWIPEITVSDVLAQEPIEGVQSVPKERWDLLCCVCRQRMGAKIQCENRGCFTAYHPLCARVAGFVMEIKDGPEGPDGPVEYVSHCARHATPQPHLSGCRLVSESEEQGDLPEAPERSGLVNGQPYELPDQVPVPACPAGAARAMPIDKWQRQQHGTGTGVSSLAAYWIPGPPQATEPPRKRLKAAGRVGLPASGSVALLAARAAEGGTRGEAGSASEEAAGAEDEGGSGQAQDGAALRRAGDRRGRGGRGRGRGNGHSWGPGRGRWNGRGRWAPPLDFDPDADEEPELLPLPPNTPEELTVWCNGHTATFTVRTQRVLFKGSDMPVPKFEAEAGLSNAKKWKCSLYTVDADGEPDEMMQDWLGERGLDRRTLDALWRNVAVRDMAREHAEQQARELLGGIIEAVKADAGEGESADEADPVSEVWVSSDGGTASPQPQPQPAGGEQQAAEPAPAEVVVKVEEGEEGEEAEVQEEEQEEEEPEAPAAVKQPPKHVSNVRAWLGGLGFQRHSDGQRSPSQRTPEGQTREEAAAAPSGATAAAAAAIQQQITGLKAALAVQQQGQPLSAAPEAAAAAQRPANGVLGKKRSLAEMSQSFSGGGCQAQSGGSAGASKAPRLGSQQGGSGGAPSGSGAAAFGPELEGEWCRIYWPEEDNWRDCQVREYSAETRTHRVLYECDYEDEWLDFAKEQRLGRLQLLPGANPATWPPPPPAPSDPEALRPIEDGYEAEGASPSRGSAAAARSAAQARSAAAGGGGGPKQQGSAAESPMVMIGTQHGRYDVAAGMMVMPDGRCVSIAEFVKGSGRATCRGWRWAIRVDRGDGTQGLSLEEWLRKRGLPIPSTAEPSAAAAARQEEQQEEEGEEEQWQDGQNASRRGRTHASDCQCAVCKVCRKAGSSWVQQFSGGSGGDDPGDDGEGAAAAPGAREEGAAAAIQARLARQQGQAHKQAASAGRALIRDGKRAFLRAVPQLATAGPTPHQLHEVPQSRCWRPEDWATHRMRQAARAAVRAGDARVPRADLAAAVAVNAPAHVDSLAPTVSLGPAIHEGRLLSIKEKLDACNATERARVAFGKSGVHGWGLFARVPMRQDSMVSEYRGVLVRASVAERREARYRQQGRDCYLFNLDDEHVLDSTQSGALCRFTNHSCSPSLYSKILNVDGQQRLVFFARHDLEAGQELTYNYRFERAEEEERLPCLCGAPNCSGFLN